MSSRKSTPRSTPRGKKVTPRKNYKKKMPQMSLAKKVHAIMARTVEVKKTVAAQAIAPLCILSALSNPTWFVLRDWDNNVWKLAAGAGQASRIGNEVKIRKWIIRGQIQPDTPGIAFNDSTGYIRQSYQGYVTIFFGRRNDTGAVDSNLTALLDSGNSTFSPAGTSTEMMLPINTDLYKIYWRKTFKMGAAYGPNASTTQSPNNDFSLVRTFGFDVTKHILKNRVLKFNDSDSRSSDRDLTRLALFAIWRPAIGSMSNPTPGIASSNHFYNINVTSYGEYEDA